MAQVEITKCPQHPDVSAVMAEGLNRFRCDQCEADVEETNWLTEVGYQVAYRTFVERKQDGLSISIAERRFAVALSFPGKHRDYVRDVANKLAKDFGESRVLFDEFHKAEFSRPNLDTHLQRLYLRESTSVEVFLCEAYEANEWCGLEWRAIRTMIKNGRDDELMLVRFDDGEVEGIFGVDGFLDTRITPIVEVARFVIQRCYKLLGSLKKC